MNVLVTGCGGLGSELVRTLAARGDGVCVLDAAAARRGSLPAGTAFEVADVRDVPRVEAVLRAHCPDAVVHTAALVGPAAVRWPGLARSVNVDGTGTLVTACAGHDVGRVIVVSSLAVYGDKLTAGPDERSATQPVSDYGKAKLAAEERAVQAVAGSAVDLYVLRLAGVYGCPRPGIGGRMNGWLRRMLAAGLAGKPISVEAAERGCEYLHVDDAVRALMAALDAHVPPQDAPRVYNVGAGTVHRGARLAEEMRELFSASTVRFTPLPGGVARPLDGRLAATALGYRPGVGLPLGLRRMREAMERHTARDAS